MTESGLAAVTVSLLRPRIEDARRDGFPEAQIIGDVAEYLESLAEEAISNTSGGMPVQARRKAVNRLNNRVMAELFPGRN